MSDESPVHESIPSGPMNSGELRSSLSRIMISVDAMARGLMLMVETQRNHSEMLREILEAATQTPGVNPIEEAMQRIAAGMDRNTHALTELSLYIGGLAGSVETAVIRGVHRAVGDVDEDGVAGEGS